MKIYINNFNIDVLSDVMKNIFETYIRSESFIQIYSQDGIYRIDDDTTIKKQICIDKDIQIFKNYYTDFTLITDPSYYTTELVHNITPDHISTRMKRHFFEINKNSKIQLVIEGEEIKNDGINANDGINVNDGIKPTDIYFEIPNNIDINDALVKKEIIVFLSLLN
jgi:hypothetical protein